MPLSDVEVRVLGALIEKERTTPEAYPLSIGACVTACNQRTSREPVTDLHLQQVQEALQRLRDRGLVATVQQVNDRVPKHRHRLAEALPADDQELALLSVLMLRGPQTAGELRARTERYVGFRDVGDVVATLTRLSARPVALVRGLGRAPGQSQDRWLHTLGVDEARLQPRVRGSAGGAGEGRTAGEAGGEAGEVGAGTFADPGPLTDERDLAQRVAALEARVERLELRFAAQEAHGGTDEAPGADLFDDPAA